jgi:hypothetical protein
MESLQKDICKFIHKEESRDGGVLGLITIQMLSVLSTLKFLLELSILNNP